MMKVLNRKHIGVTIQHPVKILQFGEGNFLRAFADWMIDIMNEKIGYAGAIQVIKPRQGPVHAINEQDGLYHVIIKGLKDGKPWSDIRLISAVKEVISPYENFEDFLKTSENPDLDLIISNTTEVGIAFDETDTSPDILPKSFPGKLTLLLFHRFQFFHGSPSKGVVIIPCELIDKGGEVLKRFILQYTRLWRLGAEFEQWIKDHIVFCNSLVDRIVPGFPKDHESVAKTIGYDDRLMVMAEPYHLWVIEPCDTDRIDYVKQKFPADQGGLDVKIVNDYSPYRTRKVRILNGAHTALVPVAYLHGLRTVREALENDYTGNFIRGAIFNEIIPTLDMPNAELTQFANDVIDRFRNPFIRHELLTISLNSVSKFRIRVLPSILRYINLKQALPGKLLFSLAALIRFYKGEWQGEPIPLNDTLDVLSFMQQAWHEGNPVKAADRILSNPALWEQDLRRIPGLQDYIIKSLTEIEHSAGLKGN